MTGDDRATEPNANRRTSDGVLDPVDLERAFSVLEAATRGPDSLDGPNLDRILSVFDRVLSNPSDTDAEDVEALLSLLEDAIIHPGDASAERLDGLLDALEEATAGVTGSDADDIATTFSVIEKALVDPAGTEPEDVDALAAAVERTVDELMETNASVPNGWLPERPTSDSTTPFKLARVVWGLTQRTMGYSVSSGVRTGARMAYAAAHTDSTAALLEETRAVAFDELERTGVDVDLGERRAEWFETDDLGERANRPSVETLRARGERLLERAATIGHDEAVHPAYGRILDQLAADEARILRLLATEGTQPSITVRDGGIVPLTSTLVAANLTMVGLEAGCRHEARANQYLHNLHRLGLVWFSDEPVGDLKRYQVLDAQPNVEAARDAASRPKSVHRSVHLTPFGVGFCRTCMPFEITADRPAGALGGFDGE